MFDIYTNSYSTITAPLQLPSLAPEPVHGQLREEGGGADDVSGEEGEEGTLEVVQGQHLQEGRRAGTKHGNSTKDHYCKRSSANNNNQHHIFMIP